MSLRAVPATPPRVLGLIRVSKEKGRGDDLLSPELQQTMIRDYCERRGYVVAEWLHGIDESGSQARSAWWPTLDRAVDSVVAGDYDGIVIRAFDRVARNRLRWAVAIDRMDGAGGIFESVTEQVDTATAAGRFTRGMFGEMAAFRAEVIGEGWKEVHASRLAKGLPHSPGPRFGYRYDRGEDLAHTPDPTEAPVLVEAYRRFIGGESFRRISAWMNEVGARTARGNPWAPDSLARTLDSGFAAGLLHSGGEHLPGIHEAIIDERTWRAYRRRRVLARREPARARQGAYPLTGLVHCARCEQPMYHWRSSHADGRRYPSYICRRGHPDSCGRNYVGDPVLHEGVKAWLAAEVAADLDARTASKAQRMARRELARSERTEIEKKIREIDRAIERLADSYARRITPQAAYEKTVAALVAEKDGLDLRLAQAADDAEAMRRDTRPLARKILRDYDHLVAADPAGMREVFRNLIARVWIEPGRHPVEVKVRVAPRWAAETPGTPAGGLG